MISMISEMLHETRCRTIDLLDTVTNAVTRPPSVTGAVEKRNFLIQLFHLVFN